MQATQQSNTAKSGKIINSLPIVAAMMGRNYGVNVVMGDFPTASTDLSTIYIPHFDPEDAAQKSATYGYIVHECGHIRCGTDIVDFSGITSERLRHLANILEDGRIERGITRIYPGAKAYLEGLTGFLIEKGHLPAAQKGDAPGKVLVLHIMHHIAYKLLNYAVAQEVYEATASVLPDYFNQAFIDRVNALLMAAVLAPDWYRVHAIAKELLKVMKQEAEREQQAGASNNANQNTSQDGAQGDSQGAGQQDGGQGDSQGAGQQDGGQGDSQGAGQQDGAQGDSQGAGQQDGGQGDSQGAGQQDGAQGDSQGAGQQDGGQGDSQGAGQQDGAQGDSQGAGQQGGSQSNNQGSVTAALESLADEMKPLSDKGAAVSPYLTSNGNHQDQGGGIKPTREAAPPVSKNGYLYREVKSYSNTLGNHLKDLLSVDTMVESGYARKGRRIEAKRLCRIRQGDMRVFRTKNIHEAEDTAIFVALDMSGSMSGIAEEAIKSTLALVLAISQIPGVDIKVCAFSSQEPVLRLKEFGEPIEEATGRFDRVGASGGTPMVPVLSNAILNLMSRPEPRKVFWMITDGDDGGKSNELFKSLPAMRIEASGFYIGEKTDNSHPELAMTAKFGKSWQWVENMKQLKQKLIKLAQENIAQRK